MTRPAPIAATERTAAQLLDMTKAEFRRLVDAGALPPPVRVGDMERWRVDDLRRMLSGQAARPNEDIDL
jgi:predicted DNA-binding transcriptional regulator AlpA